MSDSIKEWLSSSQALFTAITALIGSVTALVTALGKSRNRRSEARSVFATIRQVFTWSKPLAIVGMTLFAVAAFIGFGRFTVQQSRPRNERLTQTAWDALARKEWPTAFARASECVDTFGDQAELQQSQLEAAHASFPGTGKVQNPEQDEIFARGLLNDVGACLFIKGQAAEGLSRRAEAQAAYQAVARLTYARVYDPAGFFWSPSEAGSARLRRFQ